MGNSNGKELSSTSCDCDERRTLGNAAQCLSDLCLQEHLSDIKILFTNDKSVKLPAHNFVLKMRSKVFRDSLPPGQTTIHISNVEPEVMKVVLRFIYSDNPEIDSSNVLRCWHVAEYFALWGLVEKCRHFLEDTTDVSNVWRRYNYAISNKIKPLEEKCLTFIIENAANVLFQPDFLELSLATLQNVLKQDELAADEIDVFKAAKKWAEHHCETNRKSKTGENMRDQLKEAIFEIRFATIPISELASVVNPTEILTKDERLMLLEYIAKPDTEPPPEIKIFCKRKRTGVPITTDLRRHDSSELKDEENENE